VVTRANGLVPHPLVLFLCALALSCDIVLGPYVLRTMGINYVAFGGDPITKIHPGTYITLCAAALYLISVDHPLRVPGLLMRLSPGLGIYCFGMGLVLIYVLCVRELGSVPVILDTYFAPGLIALMLVHAPPGQLRRLLTWMIALLVINALVGIVEGRLHLRLFREVSDGVEIQEDFFRATAFVGHPLRNAMLASFAVLAVMAASWPFPVRLVLLAIVGLGMLAFGGRVSLVLVLVGGAIVTVGDLHRRAATDRGAFIRGALAGWIALVVAAAGLSTVFLLTTFGERIFGEEFAGSSTAARWQVFDVFGLVDLDSLIAGYDATSIDAMVKVLDLEQLENFWIHMLILLGFVGYLAWLPAFLAGMTGLWRRAGFVGRVILICFLLTASTTNALAKKGSMVSVAFAFVIGADCLERRRVLQDRRDPGIAPATGLVV
jgi:hypothetical protein